MGIAAESPEWTAVDVGPPPVSAVASEAPGMDVIFQDLSYTVKDRAKRRERINLLHRVSGSFQPGQMSALMGPSGSGKTTLLDVLAGRKTVGTVSGSVRIAGRPPTREFLRRYAGYVEQFDTLLANLTVYEMLLYTAEMRNKVSLPAAAKKDRVEAVLSALALQSCRDVLIGDPLHRGISGGQAKRVNIGLGLVARDTRLLFLDEPTSGLDSFTANEVMAEVRALTKLSITVVATVHSPTPYCFTLFDRLMIILSGRIVYCGNRGLAAVQYFKDRFADNPACIGDQAESEAEWLVRITTQRAVNALQADRDGQAAEFAEAYDASEMYTRIQQEIKLAGVVSEPDTEVERVLGVRRGTTVPAWHAWVTLHKFRSKKDFRGLKFLGPRVIGKTVVALVLMTLFVSQGHWTAPHNVYNTTNFLFMLVTVVVYSSTAYIPAIVLERPLYIRERDDGLYQPMTYLAFKISEEILVTLLHSLPTSVMIYYTVQLQGDWVIFWLIYFLSGVLGNMVAYFLASVSSTMAVANAALPAFVGIMVFLIGLIIRKQDIGWWWRWVVWIDPLHYAWAALMVNQFQGRDLLVEGDIEVLTFFDLQNVGKWGQVGFTSLFVVGFFFLTWAGLAFCRHHAR